MQRIALVTGGAVRVGAAITRALAEAGYTVAVHAWHHAAEAERLAAEVGGQAMIADLLDPQGVSRLVAQVDALPGRLAVLVNNAAIFEAAAPEAVTPDCWQRHLTLNLTVPLQLSQAAHPRMSGGGNIVNVLDISAVKPYPRHVHYSASKAGLLALTRGLAVAWAPAIRVNAVAPGPVVAPEGMDESDFAARVAKIPQGQLPGAQAVAAAVRFLVEGPFGVTGAVLPVDGGRHLAW